MAMKTKKTVAKTEKIAEQKVQVEVNGAYDFLISYFEKPSSIINAATALAGHSTIDPQIAVKKVEQFLENAKIDQTLEVRAGTGSNEGQYLIARVPQSAQRKNGGGREVKKAAEKKAAEKKAAEKKAAEKKAAEKKAAEKKAAENKPSRRGTLVKMLCHKPSTVEELTEGIKKLYPHDVLEMKIQRDIRWYLSNGDRLGGKLTKSEGKHGEARFTLQKS